MEIMLGRIDVGIIREGVLFFRGRLLELRVGYWWIGELLYIV